MSNFIECDTCRGKPGSPVLCNGCLANREEIMRLEKQVERIERLREILNNPELSNEQVLIALLREVR